MRLLIKQMGRHFLSIQDMHKTASERGGAFRSKTYEGSDKKHLWECAEGHRWEAKPEQVRHGSWCPICGRIRRAKQLRSSIEEMRELATEKGGRCLSTTYTNRSDKLLWECKQGHRFEKSPNNVKHRNQWCPHCSKYGKLTIEDMQEVARSRGGKCLSLRYVNNNSKLLWECSKGHRWSAVGNNVKNNNSWCPECAIISRIKGSEEGANIHDL